MIVAIDFRTQPRHVLVCIQRGARDAITYNSGLIYFESEGEANKFKEVVLQKVSDIEIKTVSTLEAFPPEEAEFKRGYWCPYCKSWEYWLTDSGGNRRCPICRMSERDYAVRQYNNLWVTRMQSKSAKRKSEKRPRRR